MGVAPVPANPRPVPVALVDADPPEASSSADPYTQLPGVYPLADADHVEMPDSSVPDHPTSCAAVAADGGAPATVVNALCHSLDVAMFVRRPRRVPACLC